MKPAWQTTRRKHVPQKAVSKYNSIGKSDDAVGKICIKLRMSTIQPNIEQPVSEEMQLVRRAKGGDDHRV